MCVKLCYSHLCMKIYFFFFFSFFTISLLHVNPPLVFLLQSPCISLSSTPGPVPRRHDTMAPSSSPSTARLQERERGHLVYSFRSLFQGPPLATSASLTPSVGVACNCALAFLFLDFYFCYFPGRALAAAPAAMIPRRIPPLF